MRKICHIINPVKVSPQSDLFVAQPITFESIRVAREFSNQIVDVRILCTCYSEDLEIIPPYFELTSLLKRSSLDINVFSFKRKLPFLSEIIGKLYDYDADIYIYTNVDIAVQKDFYIEVERIFEKGYDSFVINRRTLLKPYENVSELPQMYVDKGIAHGGYDCFIFSPQVLKKLILNNILIGAPYVGTIFLMNLVAFSRKFALFKYLFLTFHIGNDSVWLSKSNEEYKLYNSQEFNELVKFIKLEVGQYRFVTKYYLALNYPMLSAFIYKIF